MQKLLADLKNLDFAQTGTPLSPQDVASYQEQLSLYNFPSIPLDVLAFLKHYNGFLYDGRVVFGMNTKDHLSYDIIGQNASAELKNADDVLVLGATDMTWVAWVASKKTYVLIDKATQTVLHSFCDFTEAVRYVLQIYD